MQNPPPKTSIGRTTAVVCAVLLIAYAGIAAWESAGKGPTTDEPYHLAAAVVNSRLGDLRLDPEDPPLWKNWIGLATRDVPVAIDTASAEWRGLPDDILAGRKFAIQTLYFSESTDVKTLFVRAREVMLAISVLCGALLAVIAYRLGGPMAAVVATLAFVGNPTVIAHGPLVKSDLPITLVLLAMTAMLCRVLRRATWWNVLAFGALCGVGLLVKFSAVIFPAMIAAALLARAMVNRPWTISGVGGAGKILETRRQRLAAGFLLLVGMNLIAWGVLWAGYGFLFRASPEARVNLNIDRARATYFSAQRKLADPNAGPITTAEYAAWRPPISVRAIEFAYEHRLLPEAWLTGLLFVGGQSMGWPHYFLGAVTTAGHWYYFPVALAVKSPVAFLVGLIAAVVVLARRWQCDPSWTLAAGSVVCVYLLAALTTNLNEGVRHLLPLFPFMCIAMGSAAAVLWSKNGACGAVDQGVSEIQSREAARGSLLPIGEDRRLRLRGIFQNSTPGRWVVMALAAIFLLESAVAFPNHLAYFNLLAGGATGGYRLLGDSNLDWGQDLPLLAAWQREHPDETLYLAYSGAADPAHYGIRYKNLPGGYAFGPATEEVGGAGVIAISASIRQGIYSAGGFDTAEAYAELKTLPLIDVLGGSIYLYRFDPPKRR